MLYADGQWKILDLEGRQVDRMAKSWALPHGMIIAHAEVHGIFTRWASDEKDKERRMRLRSETWEVVVPRLFLTRQQKSRRKMDIQFAREGNILIAAVSGRIDGGTAHEFAASIDRSSLQDDESMIMDFAEVNYISSAGLRAILIMAKRCESENSKLALYSLSEQMMSVFEISGFARIISIFPDRADALASVKS